VSPAEAAGVGEISVFRPDMLAGRVALVTGGGTGIGLGIAACLADAGATVAIASRKPEHLAPAATRLRSRGATVSTVEANVREPEAVARMVDRVTTEHGRLDILVNNAAGNFYAASSTLSPNAWRAVVETDLYGSFYCSQAAYPAMKAQGGGRIISISMTLHYRGWPLMAHATAAKAGVDALTRTLALEWAPDRITVNAVAPGPIPTEGVQRAFTPPDARAPDLFRMDRYVEQMIPLGRWGTAEDVGRMVAFLAGPAGEWITGAIFVVDGGSWLAGGRT
jgi:peroxisomal 2,4-dienoyl-CoA reductase